MPFLSPMAWVKAWPRVMPTSSTVWWSSICQVTLALDIQIDQAMTGDLVEHVLEERHTDIEARLTGAIQVDRDLDLGLQGVALDECLERSAITSSTKLPTEKGQHYRRARAATATGDGRTGR